MAFENKLKSESRAVIHQLHMAELNLIMITGDNPLTSIYIGRECELIPENSNVLLIEKSFKKNEMYSISKINQISLEKDESIYLNEENINEITFKIKEENEQVFLAITGF